MFKYSYNIVVYQRESIDKSIQRLKKYGYDAIELPGIPDWYNARQINKLCVDNGIAVSDMAPFYTNEHYFISHDSIVRDKAIDFVKKCVDFIGNVGGKVVIVSPCAFRRIDQIEVSPEERQWAIEGIRKVGEYAKSVGVKLALEPWNRYETFFLNRIDQALDLMRDINLPNVGVMGDMFHMNIEEVSIAGAYRDAGKYLVHTHICDSSRAAPGTGHIDFAPILQSLIDINYQGFLCFELIPASADPLRAIKEKNMNIFLDDYTEHSIIYMKSIEKKLRQI